MNEQCLTEEEMAALLAGHYCRGPGAPLPLPIVSRLVSRQEPLRKALEVALDEAALDSLTTTARARLDEALSPDARPVAHYDAWPRSPVGPLFVAVSDAGLCAVSFRSSEDDFVRRLARRGFRPVRSPERTSAAIAELQEYFAGRRRRFDVLVDLTGQSPFRGRAGDDGNEWRGKSSAMGKWRDAGMPEPVAWVRR
jgi:hypothetical protein